MYRRLADSERGAAWRDTVTGFRFGVDLKWLKRNRLCYDFCFRIWSDDGMMNVVLSWDAARRRASFRPSAELLSATMFRGDSKSWLAARRRLLDAAKTAISEQGNAGGARVFGAGRPR